MRKQELGESPSKLLKITQPIGNGAVIETQDFVSKVLYFLLCHAVSSFIFSIIYFIFLNFLNKLSNFRIEQSSHLPHLQFSLLLTSSLNIAFVTVNEPILMLYYQLKFILYSDFLFLKKYVRFLFQDPFQDILHLVFVSP